MCLALGRRSNSEQGGASVHTERTHPSGSAVRARRRPKRTPKQGRAGGRPPAAAGWYFKMAKVQRWRASQEVSECGPRTCATGSRLRRHAPLRLQGLHLPIPARCCLSGPRLVSDTGTGGDLHGASNLRGRRLHAAGQPRLEARRARPHPSHPPPPPPTERPPPAESRKKISRDGRPAGRTRLSPVSTL